MKLLVIMAQRKERYQGEYGPEALEVMTEYDNDDNGEYLPVKLEEFKKSNMFENVQLITIEVSENAIMKILRPDAIAGDVL